VKRFLESLTKVIQGKKVDTTFLITHRSNDLADGPISTRPSKRRRMAA
jgi:hypothetical protein